MGENGSGRCRAPPVVMRAGTRPPRFVLLTSGFLEAGCRRFLGRRLHEDFGVAGSTTEVSLRVREKGDEV